jgi:hypothetical protein
MKDSGIDVPNCTDGGGISVQGDTTVLNFGDAANKGGSMLKKALPLVVAAIIGAAVGAAGPLVPIAYQWMKTPATATTATQPTTTQPSDPSNPSSVYGVPGYQLGLEVKDSP